MATIAQCAKHLKMNERTFKVLLDAGTIKRATRDNYDLDTVRETYIEHLRAAAEGRSDSSTGLTDARTRVATARAESAEWENQKNRGGWVKLDKAVRWMIADITVIKERLLSMAGELQGDIGHEFSILVDDKVREILTELSNPQAFAKLTRAAFAKGTITLDAEDLESMREMEQQKADDD